MTTIITRTRNTSCHETHQRQSVSSHRSRKDNYSEIVNRTLHEHSSSSQTRPVTRNCIAINKAITQAKTTRQIFRIWQESSRNFNYVNIATTLNRLARFGIASNDTSIINDISHTLLQDNTSVLNECGPQEIANIVNAFAKLGIQNDRLFEALARHLLDSDARLLERCNSQHIANIVNAFAKLGIQNDALFKAAAQCLLASHARLLERCNSQEIANIVNAFAKLGIQNDALFVAAAQCLLASDARLLKECSPQHIANIVNAFAKLGIQNDRLFQAVARCLLTSDAQLLKRCNSQDIANIVNAFAKLGIRNDTFFQAAAQCLLNSDAQLLKKCNSQHIANIVNAFAKLGIQNDRLFQAVARCLLASNARLERCNSQDIANIVNAFAKLGIQNDRLFEAVAQCLLAADAQLLKRCNSQHIANIGNAFAKLGIQNDALFEAAAQRILASDARLLERSNSQHIANIAWAFIINHYCHHDLLQRLLAECFVRTSEFTEEQLWQLHQVWLSLSYEFPKTQVQWDLSLLAKIHKTILNPQTTTSNLQDDICDQLHNLGIRFTTEESIRGLPIDIALKDRPVLIEVHGPSHYLRGTHTLDGPSKFKQRILEKIKYKVHTIPYWEWHNFSNTMEKQAYLQRLLREESTR